MMPWIAPPPAQGEGPSPQELLQQLFACFGSKVHMTEGVEYPISVTSAKQLAAIECTKPQEFEELLVKLAPMLEGRDFLGHRLYSTDLPGMMPMMPPGPGMGAAADMSMSIGISSGYVFMGTTPSVEQALRSVGASDAATLAEAAGFRRAVDALHHERVVAWGYGDVVNSMEVEAEIVRQQMEQLQQELETEDPELAEEIMEMQMGPLGEMAHWLDEVDYELLREYFGPVAWEVVATEEGFIARSYLLAAEGRANE